MWLVYFFKNNDVCCAVEISFSEEPTLNQQFIERMCTKTTISCNMLMFQKQLKYADYVCLKCIIHIYNRVLESWK